MSEDIKLVPPSKRLKYRTRIQGLVMPVWIGEPLALNIGSSHGVGRSLAITHVVTRGGKRSVVLLSQLSYS